MQWGPIAALTAASGYFLLLGLVIRKRGLASPAERWFAGYLIISALWTVAWTFANLWQGLQVWVVDLGGSVSIYTAALLPPVLAVLSLQFLSRRGVREVAVLGLVWAIAVVLVERRVVSLTESEAVLGVLRPLGWIGFIVGSLALTALEYSRLRRPLHRNRVLYWLVALILVAVGEGWQHIRGDVLAELGLPTRLLGAMMMTYAIITYTLPDLKSVGRRFMLALITTLVRALLFLITIIGAVSTYRFLADRALNEKQLLWFIVIGALGGALLLAIVQIPVQSIVAGMARRLLFGPGYDASRALRDYSQHISNILHMERLVRTAIETIAEALDVEQGGLLDIIEREDGSGAVRVVPGMGNISSMDVAFAPGSPVLHRLREDKRPLTQYDIDMLPEFRAMDPEERQWQWALDVEVYVPIHVKNDLIGALVLGAKQTGEPYDAQDLDVLNTLAGQTAVALQNARLFGDQRRMNREIGQLNEELIAANERLEKLDKVKTDFMNITSHELRTPLTQVRGYADILGEMVEDEEISRTYVTKIASSIRLAADRLQEIYSAMLDASAIGADALRLHFDKVPPAYFISQATLKWEKALRQRQQKLVTKGIDQLPNLEGDPERLTQAFSNLINNAIKFTPDGGQIEIRGRVVEGPEPVIEIVVADTGIGIDPNDHEMIFEKFYRVGSIDVHSTGNIKFMGAGPGLGLPIAKGVIEGHGGRIWVESDGCDEEICPGSRFHVLIPLERPAVHSAQFLAD
jgi:signal transduction histidine kinase